MFKYALEKRMVEEFDLQEVDTLEFYRAVFPLGCLEETGNMKPGKYNAMVHAIMPDNKNKYILCVHDDLKQLTEIRCSNAKMNCVSYIGKAPEPGYERELFAFFIRVNTPSKLEDAEALLTGLQGYLEYGMVSRKSPTMVNGKYQWDYSGERSMSLVRPSFLVVDNEQLYLCYVMNRPIPMFENYQRKLQAICNDLSRKINQGLRLQIPEPQHILTERTVVGKSGCRAYRLPGDELYRISVDELNGCVAKAKQLHISTPKEWTCKPDLFEWFKRQVCENVDNENLKSRVFVAIAAYAVKSGVTKKEFWNTLNEFSDVLAHRFGPDEIKEQITDACFFYAYHSYWLKRRKIVQLSEDCGFEIKQKPRNHGKDHKSRTEHCQEINAARKLEKAVLDWMSSHPGKKKIDCANALGISPSTVTKWLQKAADATAEQPRKPRKKNVCPCCGGKLAQVFCYGLKFNKRSGKYKQRVSKVCQNPNCEKHNQEVSHRYRTVEDGFQEERNSGPIYTHVYGKEEHKKAPATPTVQESFIPANISDADDIGWPW